MNVQNVDSLRSSGTVRNQFIIKDGRYTYFQSYDSIIVKIDHKKDKTVLDKKTWNYSNTTRKYRSNFLGEDSKTIKAKIKSGEYKLINLND